MQITLVNHACVKLAIGDVVILCDPWIEGPVFNAGWDLLVETPLPVADIMRDVTHIWVSHEHPDHFSPKFFNDVAASHAGSVPVLFQHTRDQRVRNFLTSRGFTVIELADREPHTIRDVSVTCGREDFYDSWLHASDGRGSILNLNDCGESGERELRRLKQLIGPVDVLLTQFSYAAWKGGRDNAYFRKQAARNKLRTITAQIAAIKPRHVVPFASLVYFSNEENAYLNDSVNTPAIASDAIAAAGAQPIVLFPGDRWSVGEPYDDTAARERYRTLYAHLPTLPLRSAGASVPLVTLQSQFDAYRRRIFGQNSPLLLKFLRTLPVLGALRPVVIQLTDLDTLVGVSVTDGMRSPVSGQADVAMHSSSLSFIFMNPFGFDTLTVNGRFEATPDGFSRMTKSLALGSLNAMGLAISPKLLLNLDVVSLLLRRLASVVGNLSRGDALN